MTPKHTDVVRRQRRLLFWLGVLLLFQVLNTVFLWRATGRFHVWAGIALLGMILFTYFAFRQYRRAQLPPPAPPGEPRKRKRRLRDPHRKGK